MREKNDEYFNTREALGFLRVSDNTLRKWRKEGVIPFYRIGGKYLYKESELREAIDKNKRTKE